MTIPHYSGTPVEGDLRYHDGGLRPAVGVHNFQVLRANHTYPAQAEGCGYTYNHAPMLCYWRGRFWLEFLSGPRHEHQAPCHTLLTHSPDGRSWSTPQVVFPTFTLADGALTVAHQRMGFYVAPNGRLLILAFCGKLPTPNDGTGIGRAVREIDEDGTVGPLYFLRYNPGYGPQNTPYPFYATAPDPEFISACAHLLGDPLMVQQWYEDDQKAQDDLYVVRGSGPFQAKAFCWYTLPDGRIVGMWKDHYFTVAAAWTPGEVPLPEPAPTIRYGWGKCWGQRTADGRYALVYNRHGGKPERRYPLAITTSADGLTFDSDLLTVHGEVPPQRFFGVYKDAGPQYIRGTSITSARQITPLGAPPYFILIDRAVRDEGTSYHYQPPATYSHLQPALLDQLATAFVDLPVPVYRGTTWTTDAPFRETAVAIAHHQQQGVYAVEMEAAALYAFATATGHPVVCFAHVTNQMAQIEGDFEKGADNGSQDALAIVARVSQRWRKLPHS
jgi:hypothetical protein